jgi:hypothetical protein
MVNDMANISCFDCVYRGRQVLSSADEIYLCHRNPPLQGTFVNAERLRTLIDTSPYPLVDKSCWCGEHQNFKANGVKEQK